MSELHTEWHEQSRQALSEALAHLFAKLEARQAGRSEPQRAIVPADDSALARITRKFRLTGFETDLLLLLAGVEVEPRMARLVAQLQGGERHQRPTFSLALSLLDDPHWSALAPGSVLRRGRLIRTGESPGLVDAPLAIEESVLYFLGGWKDLDERLRPYVTRLRSAPLAPSQQLCARRLVETWCTANRDEERPKVFIVGADTQAGRSVAASASQALGFSALALDLASLPADRAQVEELLELWQRDAVLNDFALVVDSNEAETPERRNLAGRLLDTLNGLVVVVGERQPATRSATVTRLQLEEPSLEEQADLWRTALGPLAAPLNGHLGRLVEQFRLPAHAIVKTAAEMRLAGQPEPAMLAEDVWRACRSRARGGLDDLAQRIESKTNWQDLVLPEPQMQLLRSIAVQTRYRFEVYETWGFRARSSRGFGVSALFSGPSGVGKTLAAEVLACDLELDLYRIDLSAAVSKYIGETEKNLRRVFDAAESSGAILLFDEADALFGKRSEVRDSHDRYANLEVSYLLQRVEAYRGLAILTTNMKCALDQAFLRRLRFVVHFASPSATERERIWRRAFPRETPLDSRIDWDKLARLAVTGGNIANIALDAAFRAAHDGTPVTMRHLLEAAHAECAKIEKPLAENEIRGWV